MGTKKIAMITTADELVEYALAEYESPLIGYAMTILKDLERARDVVQDTFIRLYKQDVEMVKDGLKTWLYTVCRNRALDVLRKEKRMVVVDDEMFSYTASNNLSPDKQVDQSERVTQLMSYLNILSENQRDVILMKFQDGMSYQEISDATGLTTGNVGFLLHNGLKKLREILPQDLI
jgi:RNA polymerase sigma factor (sigma-70 family)